MTVIRSSTLSVASSNTSKLASYHAFIAEYRRVHALVVDELWVDSVRTKFVDHKRFKHIETWLSAAMMQSLGRRVSVMVNAVKKGGFGASKPNSTNVFPTLNANQARIDWSSSTSFDGWLTAVNIGKRGTHLKLVIPLKRTEHFNRLSSKARMMNSWRLSSKGITFAFELDVKLSSGTKTLGIDVGITDIITSSDGQTPGRNHPHGHTLSSIQRTLSRRKKGSKGFKRAQAHRDNFIGWSVNRLNLDDVGELKLEDLRGLRDGRRVDRFRSHWTHSRLTRRLELKAETHGVRVVKVNPRNTSRTCPVCDAVDAKNRDGKSFVCVACGHADDADSVAAQNIARAPAGVRRGASSPSCKKSAVGATS